MIKRSFQPVSVVGAVPFAGGIRFLKSDSYVDIGPAQAELVWSVLEHCDGHATKDHVIAAVRKQNPRTSKEIASVINDLTSLGVLVDSRAIHIGFHALSSNPQPYSHSLSSQQQAEYSVSPRHPVHRGEFVSLPSEGRSPLTQVLRDRTSCRKFLDKPISVGDVAVVLENSYGHSIRGVPSGGNLRPLRLFVVAFRQLDGLESGVYEYDDEAHGLIAVSDSVDPLGMEYAFNSSPVLHGAPVALLVTADLWRHSLKYSNRGYRFTLLEAGHVAQAAHMVAQSIGLATLEYVGINEPALVEELGLSQEREAPIVAIALGYSSPVVASGERGAILQKIVGKNKVVDSVVALPSENRAAALSGKFYAADARYRGPGDRGWRYSGATASDSETAAFKAAMEAYERYRSGCVRVDAVAAASDLSLPWFDPRLSHPFAPEQREHLSFLAPFSPDEPWEWVTGRSMDEGNAVMVPVDVVFYPIHEDELSRKLCVETNSSGVAAHTDAREASERALLELIERDSIMRRWLSGEPARRIVGKGLPRRLARMGQSLSKAGWQAHFLAVESHGAVVVETLIEGVGEGKWPAFVSGAAASFSSFEAAAEKAFQEAYRSLCGSAGREPKRIAKEKVQSPAEHGEYYQHVDNARTLEWLWSGDQSSAVPAPQGANKAIRALSPVIVDLSDPNVAVTVVRALSYQLVPIAFGFGSNYLDHPKVRGRLDQRSLAVPHYFA